MKKKIKIIALISVCLCIFALIYAFAINAHVKAKVKNNILTEEQIQTKENIDCIIVLGAKVENGQPRPMLKDRLDVGIRLYNNQVSPKLLMSGDHGQKDYDEVNVMKSYAEESGVPSEDIFMDHAGFSTYESVYRAKEIFKAKKVVIVTQKYHLYRSLYIAEKLGLEAYGIASDPRQYAGQVGRDFREILARNKDFIKCIFKLKPTYLGEAIPVSGNGNITNDKPKEV